MGKRRNNTLTRKQPTREYRKIFWVNTEGQTEQDYLQMDIFKKMETVTIKMPKRVHPGKTNPKQVLQRLKDEIKRGNFRKGDEAWVAIDMDAWSYEDIREVVDWANTNDYYNVVISNPKIELFLIMHFEKGNGCTTNTKVDERLSRHLPSYAKRLTVRQFDRSQIETAIEHARTKRTCCIEPIPDPGMTDFYKLVERLLEYC